MMMLSSWPLSYLRRRGAAAGGGSGGSSGGDGGSVVGVGAVSLVDGEVLATQFATASLIFRPDGSEVREFGSPPNRQWISPVTGMSQIEIVCVLIEGSVPLGSPIDEWLSMDAERSWQLRGGVYGRTSKLRVSLRRAANPSAILATCQISLHAEGSGGDGLEEV